MAEPHRGPRKGQPAIPLEVEKELSIEELMAEIESRRAQLTPAGEDDIPADAYPNYYWECIDAETSGASGHPIYRWVGKQGGLPTCPVCGSERAWERGATAPQTQPPATPAITGTSAPTH